jgi:cobalamin biosynthesis protein CobT
MSSIFILKEILDLLYEESKRGELVTTDVQNRLHTLEKQLEEKNKELSKLYTENIRLENILRRYEKEFEVLTKMPLVPMMCSEMDATDSKVNTVEYNEQVENQDAQEENVEQQEPQQEEEPDVFTYSDRKEYMKEYLRRYRKSKREKKEQVNVNI